VSPPGAGTGAGEAQFVASPNLSSSPRTGSLTIAGQTYTVYQAGAPCAYTLSAPGVTVTFGGTIAASFGVTTATGGCSPTAVSYASWITVSTSFVGTSGTVTYTVAPNPSTVSRAGAVQVGNQIFTVTELGGTCGWSLNTYGALFNSGGGAGVVSSNSGVLTNLGDIIAQQEGLSYTVQGLTSQFQQYYPGYAVSSLAGI